MGVWVTLYALAPEDHNLTRDEFTALIVEALDLYARDHGASASTGPAPTMTLISGAGVLKPMADGEDLRGAFISGYFVPPPAGMTFPSPYHEATLWYSGSERAALEAALRQAPYGADDLLVSVEGGPDCVFYAFPQPREIAFVNGWNGDVAYRTTRQMCEFSGEKGGEPSLSDFEIAPALMRAYGAPDEVYSYS